mmetsp:Transcript_14427/g.17538  ORF Transcript_14427/g.17538 Transcript_14427/m.17538 type:complete len:321 (-) Transcript_14427:241-1203(-)
MTTPKSETEDPTRKCTLTKHSYHDYAYVIEAEIEEIVGSESQSTGVKKSRRGPRGGVTTPFPEKLHALLEAHQYPHIISWQSHGRCFILRKPQDFLCGVMPKYFKQTKLTSFQRQLNLYGFKRITSGPDKGAYYHELFLRGKPSLCSRMIRIRVKGTRIKSAACPENEPNFYAMPPVNSPQFCPIKPLSNDTHPGQPRLVYASSNESTSASSLHDSERSESRSQSPCDLVMCSDVVTTIEPQFTPNSLTNQQTMPPLEQARFPEPRGPKTITFGGKGFYYLDSFDQWDVNSFATETVSLRYRDSVGLSVGPNGEPCGFEV